MVHQRQIHGPARIGNNTFIGIQSLAFRVTVGDNCVIESKALVTGVNIPDGRYVPVGGLITTHDQADKLPITTSNYPLRILNNAVVHVNRDLAIDY